MKRPGQPKELAPVYVMLASDESSYVSGATVAVTAKASRPGGPDASVRHLSEIR
jgi:NAD(P)-dependent dehydrogenase (short-subunit alcohol dehydrogenase family)